MSCYSYEHKLWIINYLRNRAHNYPIWTPTEAYYLITIRPEVTTEMNTMNKSCKQAAYSCLFDLLINPEDGGGMFLRNLSLYFNKLYGVRPNERMRFDVFTALKIYKRKSCCRNHIDMWSQEIPIDTTACSHGFKQYISPKSWFSPTRL
jgi:hypothetical protein